MRTETRIPTDTRIVSALYHHSDHAHVGHAERIELTTTVIPDHDTLAPLWRRLEAEIIGIDPRRKVEDPQKQRLSVGDFVDGLGGDLYRSGPGAYGRVYRVGGELRAYWMEFRDPYSDRWETRPTDAEGTFYDA